MDATTKRSSDDSPGDASLWSLVFTSTDPDNPRVVRVRLPETGTFVIGRGEASTLRIIDSSVSRAHCVIRIEEGRPPTIEDAGSVNGTRVDGKALSSDSSEAVTLRQGSVIELEGFIGLVQPVQDGDPMTAIMGPRNSSGGGGSTAKATSVAHDGIIIESAAMKEAWSLIDLVASSDISVLLLGETGTGKDVFAEAIHRASSRRDKPYVRLNCAALPENLLEAELFGYERGAFTGAVAAKAGLIESADGGTLFLDEIGEMPLAMQAKLLRVLENGEILRLGALRPQRVDVRFVAATNRDLEAAARQGTFRSDLYYRLDGVSVSLPPLRDRAEEIVSLSSLFISRSKGQTATAAPPPPAMTDAARDKLLAHDWPGNVRELRNVIERALLLSRGSAIDAPHIVFSAKPRPTATAAPAGTGVKSELAALERKRILEVLEQCGGNKTRAAKVLGVSRTTLLARLDEYDIPKG